MICNNCGEKLENNFKFCPICGTKVFNFKDATKLIEDEVISNKPARTKEEYLKAVFNFESAGIFNDVVLNEMFSNGVFLTEGEMRTFLNENNKCIGFLGEKAFRQIVREYNDRFDVFG